MSFVSIEINVEINCLPLCTINQVGGISWSVSFSKFLFSKCDTVWMVFPNFVVNEMLLKALIQLLLGSVEEKLRVVAGRRGVLWLHQLVLVHVFC